MGLTIQVGPAVATAVASLFDRLFTAPGNAPRPGSLPTASMTPTKRAAFVRSELDRAINDPSLTEQQRFQLQQLLPMYEGLEQFARDSYDRAPSDRSLEAQHVILQFVLPQLAGQAP